MSDNTAPIETTTGRSTSPALLILLALLGAAAVGALVYFFVLGPGDDLAVEPEPAAAVDDETNDPEVPELTIEGAQDSVEAIAALPVVTYEVFLSRDPFEPVIEPIVVPASETDGAETDGSETDGTESGDDAASDDATIQPAPDGQGGCQGEEELVCDGQVVTLIGVSAGDDEPIATIQVNTTIYDVQRGQPFAEHFEVRAIDGSCVTLLYGDDAFQLCEGDRVMK